MSISLPPDKLADIQQLDFSSLQTQPVTGCWVMSFLGMAQFCASGHSQLQRLFHVIQSDMFTVYHSPTHLFSLVHFSFSALWQLKNLILKELTEGHHQEWSLKLNLTQHRETHLAQTP